MAIEKETGFAAPGTSAPRMDAPMAAPTNTPTGWDFLSMGAMGGLTRGPSSEILNKANVAVLEALKSISLASEYSLHLLKVDNTKETALRLSSLVFVVYRATTKQLGYHTVLLEGSADKMPPRVENYNGAQISIDRFAADVYDARYVGAVADLVSKAFPGVSAKECAGVVCPRTFNWEDKDALRQFINNCVLPCIADLETRVQGFKDINIAEWNRQSSLQVQVAFNEPTRTDYTGLPIRNDVTLSLAATSSERQDNSTLNNQERSQTIAQVGGFIDLVWSPEVEAQNIYGSINPTKNQKFAARFVMTSMENVMRMTPASQLLALASVLTIGEGTNWYPYYAPRNVGTGGRVVDMRDVGAINIEANVTNDPSGYGKKIDTKAASFNQMELGRLIQMAIRPGMTFSLDVSACGSDTWYNEVFAAAASGNPGANRVILEAANTLTGGAFARHYQGNRSPVIQNDDRILLGHYIGQDGARHDIRDIDYLAVMNLVGEKDHHAPQAWSDTFLRLDYPIHKRLDARKGIIADLVGTEVTFTQTAQRVTYDGEFLNAFAMACRDVGLNMRVINPALHGEYVNNRGTAGWITQANMGVTPTGLYNAGYQGGQPQAAQRSFSNRW